MQAAARLTWPPFDCVHKPGRAGDRLHERYPVRAQAMNGWVPCSRPYLSALTSPRVDGRLQRWAHANDAWNAAPRCAGT